MSGQNGFILQRCMSPHPSLAGRFGPRLWSVRVLVLVRPDGPIIHRAPAKIATGANPADNYWRPGNLMAALDPLTGQITREVRGVGVDLTVCAAHPDTDTALVGTALPDWIELRNLVTKAACVFPAFARNRGTSRAPIMGRSASR